MSERWIGGASHCNEPASCHCTLAVRMSLIPKSATTTQKAINPKVPSNITITEVVSSGSLGGHGNKYGSEEAVDLSGRVAALPVGVGTGGMVVATQAFVTHEAMSVTKSVTGPVAASVVVGPTSVRTHWAWPSDSRVQEYSA